MHSPNQGVYGCSGHTLILHKLLQRKIVVTQSDKLWSMRGKLLKTNVQVAEQEERLGRDT